MDPVYRYAGTLSLNDAACVYDVSIFYVEFLRKYAAAANNNENARHVPRATRSLSHNLESEMSMPEPMMSSAINIINGPVTLFSIFMKRMKNAPALILRGSEKSVSAIVQSVDYPVLDLVRGIFCQPRYGQRGQSLCSVYNLNGK